jgi:hypothetical protein
MPVEYRIIVAHRDFSKTDRPMSAISGFKKIKTIGAADLCPLSY